MDEVQYGRAARPLYRNGRRGHMAHPAHGHSVTASRKTSPALGEVPLFVR